MKLNANAIKTFASTICPLLLATGMASCESEPTPIGQVEVPPTTFCAQFVNTSSGNVPFAAVDSEGTTLAGSLVTLQPASVDITNQARRVLLTGQPPITFSVGSGATQVLGNKSCQNGLLFTPTDSGSVEIIRVEASNSGLVCLSEGSVTSCSN